MKKKTSAKEKVIEYGPSKMSDRIVMLVALVALAVTYNKTIFVFEPHHNFVRVFVVVGFP